MHLSVVIATKDREKYVDGVLAALRAQTSAPPFEVVVVDNGSSDGTRSVVERHERQGLPVTYVFESRPNRAKARNRGAAVARGEYLCFCDDDVVLPSGWLAAHAAGHAADGDYVVNGPIINVPSASLRPKPRPANYSRAFLCTCNASLPARAFHAAGGFDEGFELYGWEDTELGLRLRTAGLAWRFAWDAYLWHLKPPAEETLTLQSRKAVERARMARRFLAKHPSTRARMATGAHPVNVVRARYFLPDALLALYAGVATSSRAPAWIGSIARAAFLDGIYARELVKALDASDE
jgi:glycosyltransferase involved in cell wall biosynthesis